MKGLMMDYFTDAYRRYFKLLNTFLWRMGTRTQSLQKCQCELMFFVFVFYKNLLSKYFMGDTLYQ